MEEIASGSAGAAEYAIAERCTCCADDEPWWLLAPLSLDFPNMLLSYSCYSLMEVQIGQMASPPWSKATPTAAAAVRLGASRDELLTKSNPSTAFCAESVATFDTAGRPSARNRVPAHSRPYHEYCLRICAASNAPCAPGSFAWNIQTVTAAPAVGARTTLVLPKVF